MRLIPQQTTLLASIVLASVFLPSVCQAQDNGPVPRSTRSWLQDPAIKEEYKKWLREDAAYIITDQERERFKTLATDKERDEFVAAFWERRNPSPAGSENIFKEQHYQRLAYANTHFAANVLGWKTDRGRIYITFGPPDNVVRLLSGNAKRSDLGPAGWPQLYIGDFGLLASHGYESNRDALQKNPFDSEEWHWNYVEGGVTIKFVDTCFCGEYRMQVDDPQLRQYPPH
jgi:GWxTD domain-containing protein